MLGKDTLVLKQASVQKANFRLMGITLGNPDNTKRPGMPYHSAAHRRLLRVGGLLCIPEAF